MGLFQVRVKHRAQQRRQNAPLGYTRGLEEIHPSASNHVAAEVLTQQFQHLVLVHGDWIREVDDDAADLTLDMLRTLPPSSRVD